MREVAECCLFRDHFEYGAIGNAPSKQERHFLYLFFISRTGRIDFGILTLQFIVIGFAFSLSKGFSLGTISVQHCLHHEIKESSDTY